MAGAWRGRNVVIAAVTALAVTFAALAGSSPGPSDASLSISSSSLSFQTPAAIPSFGATSVPVLLVPGWGDDETHLAELAARFQRAGWPTSHVRTLSFEDPVGSNREHSRELALAAIELKTRSGAERIDVVAHSMGGLATLYFLQNGGDAHVRRVVFLATPHRGTVSAFFAWGEGAQEMKPGSPFLLGLMRAPVIPPGVRAVTIRTPIDLHIVPPDNAAIPGLPDLKVCCPTHAGLLDDASTFELIQRFLKAAD